MPIYTYRCNDCEHEFEQRQRMSDDPLTDCPVCHGQLRRVVNAVGVVFKGSGFYITDNRGHSNGISSSVGKTGTSSSQKDKKADDLPSADKTTKAETTTKAAS